MLTQHDQGISDEPSDADEREQYENRPRHGALQLVIERVRLVLMVEVVSEISTNLAEHV